jgi:hypothetical protein
LRQRRHQRARVLADEEHGARPWIERPLRLTTEHPGHLAHSLRVATRALESRQHVDVVRRLATEAPVDRSFQSEARPEEPVRPRIRVRERDRMVDIFRVEINSPSTVAASPSKSANALSIACGPRLAESAPTWFYLLPRGSQRGIRLIRPDSAK